MVLQYGVMGIMIWFLWTGSTITNSRIETLTLESKIFNNQRSLRIYLPEDYQGERSFKVLYLNDGQDLFGFSHGGPPHEWRADEIMDSLVQSGMEPLIIVGIDHMGRDRPNEYLPWPDEYLDPPLPQPQGALYPEFLTNEVMPLIEQKYKVRKGRNHTGIGGASYGGLITLYTLLMKPEKFGFALIESPSLYVNQQQIIQMVHEKHWKWPSRLYLGIGTNEMALENCGKENEDNLMAVNDVVSLQQLVKSQSPQTSVFLNIDSCATHHENAWSKRLPSALKFLADFQ